MAARDSVAHDLVEDERVETVRGAPARPRAASKDGDVLLVDLCVLAISRIEMRLDLGDLEADGLRVELVVRKPAREEAGLA